MRLFYPPCGHPHGPLRQRSLAKVALGPAAFLPVPEDGDDYHPGDYERGGDQEQNDVLRCLTAEVRVEEGLGEDTEGRGGDEAPEAHLGEPRRVRDGVEGDARQE